MAKNQSRRQYRQKGTVAIEFALVAPVMFLFVIAMIEISTALAVNTFLEGGLRQASRFGVTGGTGGVGREARIRQILADNSYGIIDPNQIAMDTRTYGSFAEVGDETFTDTNNNGTYDPGEPFVDRNNNGRWSPDGGTPGMGSGNDIVVYRVTYNWRFLTGLMRPFMGEMITFRSGIAVRNEPF